MKKMKRKKNKNIKTYFLNKYRKSKFSFLLL